MAGSGKSGGPKHSSVLAAFVVISDLVMILINVSKRAIITCYKYLNKDEYKIRQVADILSTIIFRQITVYGEYIYLAGGGGGSTGIPNEIVCSMG